MRINFHLLVCACFGTVFCLLVVTWNRTYTLVVFRYRVIFSPDSNFHLHALLRAAGNFSLLRRKITPYLHII